MSAPLGVTWKRLLADPAKVESLTEWLVSVNTMAASLWMTERYFAARRGITLCAWAELDEQGREVFGRMALDVLRRRLAAEHAHALDAPPEGDSGTA